MNASDQLHVTTTLLPERQSPGTSRQDAQISLDELVKIKTAPARN